MQKGVENEKVQDARVLPEGGNRGCDVIKADMILLTNADFKERREHRSRKKME
jgi:hypothetical protein